MIKLRDYILIGALLLACACSDWLDVKPKTQMKEEVIYSTEQGFQDVLTGVYIQMANAGMYGKNMTMYIPEILARHWVSTEASSTDMLYVLSQGDMTNAGAESLFKSLYKAYYACIGQLNDLLAHVENNGGVLDERSYNYLRGEALGLRAFLHFDLFRLFGPIPDFKTVDTTALVIPYVEELTKDVEKLRPLPFTEVRDKIIRDLNEAEKLLNHDAIKGSVAEIERKDYYTLNRSSRFNYYAVKAIQARFYQWFWQPERATNCALAACERIRLCTETDPVFTSEVIFAVHNPLLQNTVRPLFEGDEAVLQQKSADLKVFYEAGNNPDDIRYKTQGNNIWNANGLFMKYLKTDTYVAPNIVPVVRMSEMYLIAMENLPIDSAAQYFNKFRLARNMNATVEADFVTSRAARIAREYHKDFVGEGVTYFYNKRKSVYSYTLPSFTVIPEGCYVIPLPKSIEAFYE